MFKAWPGEKNWPYAAFGPQDEKSLLNKRRISTLFLSAGFTHSHAFIYVSVMLVQNGQLNRDYCYRAGSTYQRWGHAFAILRKKVCRIYRFLLFSNYFRKEEQLFWNVALPFGNIDHSFGRIYFIPERFLFFSEMLVILSEEWSNTSEVFGILLK